ncbi:serine carboxypeptidase-like [Tripterygium wilfordii]|uniref:serine carboxypeptidase-like n=1 Tax=Tripterygium wilfordii TaxID=458696 RepID=UPI0018F7FF89|nr:serine carboxypeptidase-like [Tripterygium wilfordii]
MGVDGVVGINVIALLFVVLALLLLTCGLLLAMLLLSDRLWFVELYGWWLVPRSPMVVPDYRVLLLRFVNGFVCHNLRRFFRVSCATMFEIFVALSSSRFNIFFILLDVSVSSLMVVSFQRCDLGDMDTRICRVMGSFARLLLLSFRVLNLDNSLVVPVPRLVEHMFKFPFLSASEVSVEDLHQYVGYYKLPHTKDAMMFYFFFESRNSKNDPLVLWLTGGPGASGSIALFYENGPFHITDELTLTPNEYSWNNMSNIIYVDQPTGTGFSYTTNDDDIRNDTIGVSNDLYDFLQEFLDAHPDMVSNEFFITGESYAGHFSPSLAARIFRGNTEEEGIPINLQGFAIGNGLTNPRIQYLSLTDYAWHNKLIIENDYHSIQSEAAPECESFARNCDMGVPNTCHTAFFYCQDIFMTIVNIAGNINSYDIRIDRHGASDYDFSKLERFMNLQSVKNALGVNKQFALKNETVYGRMLGDYMKSFDADIPALLENGIKALIYAGDKDLTCNWLGNLRWLHEMKWLGQREFIKAPVVDFKVDNITAGLMTSHGSLTFIKVKNAGHMVPMDQPKVAFHMIKNWMQDELE